MLTHGDDYRKMIHTAAWQKLRRDTLSRCPLCARCQSEGALTPATEVHHIVPVDDGLSMDERRRLMFDPHNLQALCHRCHVLTHVEMGRGGKLRAQRVNASALDAFKKKFL